MVQEQDEGTVGSMLLMTEEHLPVKSEHLHLTMLHG